MKTNAILLIVLMASAAALVTSQHRARTLYAELEREREVAKQIETEWGQLNIEQSTWSMHSRIEKVASMRLHMTAPNQNNLQMLDPAAPHTPQTPTLGGERKAQ